jgi:hypothetical protein
MLALLSKMVTFCLLQWAVFSFVHTNPVLPFLSPFFFLIEGTQGLMLARQSSASPHFWNI